MHCFAPASYKVSCHQHRLILPFRHLSKDHPQHKWEVGLTDPSGDYDALFVYGSQPLSNAPEIASLKYKGKKIVYNLDDTYWDWPKWRHDVPTLEIRGMVELMVELSDLIVASTPALSEAIGRPHKTLVCPNLTDVSSYRLSTPPSDDERIRICWSGAAAHKGDLELIDAACSRILEKWQGKVEFHFVGAGPDNTLRDWWGKGATLYDWCDLAHYPHRLHCIRPHICLAPLADCPFNHSKSAIRIGEAWALNAACIASPIAEYRVVEDHKDGLLCDSEDDWFWAMDYLIRDRNAREKLAANGWRHVNDEWNWGNPKSREKWRPLVDVLDSWEKHE